MSDFGWVGELILKLEDLYANGGKITWTDETGHDIAVAIGKQEIDLLRQNQLELMKISKDVFKEFLLLMSKRQDFDALVLIYEQLDNSSLIAIYKEDSIKLAEIAKNTQAERDFWLWFGKQFAQRVVFGALSALI
jgi:hypothetical protein